MSADENRGRGWGTRVRGVGVRIVAVLALLLSGGPASAADETLVFAASSLKTVIDEAVAAYGAAGGGRIKASYAGSAALARQIEAGAPADLFIAADPAWADHLAERGLAVAGGRRDLAGNRLVLIGSAKGGGEAAPVPLGPGLDLAALLGAEGRLAIGDPDTVPAGAYGRAALKTLGAWDGVAKRLAPAENVRMALALVARGEAPAGIVYATDAREEPNVDVIGLFPADSHPPIVYSALPVAGSRGRDAAGFLDFLSGPGGLEIFARHGFSLK